MQIIDLSTIQFLSNFKGAANWYSLLTKVAVLKGYYSIFEFSSKQNIK